MKKLAEILRNNGWKYEPAHNESRSHSLFPAAIPSIVRDFCMEFDILESPDEIAWFFSHLDYAEISDSAFKWNEFEENGVASSINQKQVEEVAIFWKKYFPIAMSVKDDYRYLAIGIDPSNEGKIFMGENCDEDDLSLISNSPNDFEEVVFDYYHNNKKILPLTWFFE